MISLNSLLISWIELLKSVPSLIPQCVCVCVCVRERERERDTVSLTVSNVVCLVSWKMGLMIAATYEVKSEHVKYLAKKLTKASYQPLPNILYASIKASLIISAWMCSWVQF